MRKYFVFDLRFMVRAWLCAAICIIWLGVPATAQRPTIITYDAPGAGTGAGQGTFASYINDLYLTTGWYVDSSGLSHGYLRYPNGTFASFDAPDATGGTSPIFPNIAGEIAGVYFDSAGTVHGFIRYSDGDITEFDFPNSPQGTYLQAFNSAGAVAGLGWDANGLSHGFIRYPDGKFTEFDPPGLGTGCSGVWNPSCGTWPLSINDEGVVTGYSVKSDGAEHSFVRAPDGTITQFDAPHAGQGLNEGAAAFWITDAGEIAGADHEQGVFYGFVRTPKGKFTEFSVPAAGTGNGQGTFAWASNQANVVTGWWMDANGLNHAFIRYPDGNITTFDATGAGTVPGQGTFPENINDEGAISGLYVDNNNVTHGFLRMP